jgi:hypothetical protein
MPFESENALSNLGGLISDEVTVNLVENVPGIKIIPTSVTRNFLLNSSTPVSGIPDLHSIHSLKKVCNAGIFLLEIFIHQLVKYNIHPAIQIELQPEV